MEHIILSLIIDYFSAPNAVVTESAPLVQDAYVACFPTKEKCAQQYEEIITISKKRAPGKERLANYRIMCFRHITPEEKDDFRDLSYKHNAAYDYAEKRCAILNALYDEKLTRQATKTIKE